VTEKGIAELEERIGVAPGFFDSLVREDDWSFIIKLHALLEAACTHFLLFHFKEPALADVLARLELSNKTSGKIAFLGALELVDKPTRRYIAALSELRNSLVHDVRNSRFQLVDWVLTLDSTQLKQFATAFSPYETRLREMGPRLASLKLPETPLPDQASVEAVVARAKSHPKEHIWLGAYNVLLGIVEMHDYSEYRQWARARQIFGEDD
jgi:hypothetical protein